ncbi:MAG: hypothetical protein AB7K64_09530 [Variibacter sp.]
MTHRLFDPEDLDERGVLRDGARVTVPMHLMDGMQRSPSRTARMTDAFGAAAGHRPGYVFADGARTASEDARAGRDQKLQDAWRGPRPLRLSPTTPVRVTPAAPRAMTVDEAREERDRRLSNAWRVRS